MRHALKNQRLRVAAIILALGMSFLWVISQQFNGRHSIGVISMTNLANFVTSQNAIRTTAGAGVNMTFTAEPTGYDQSGTVPTLTAAAIGWQAGATSLATNASDSGKALYNALVLDGTHSASNFQFSVDATGVVSITDESAGAATSGQNMNVSGLSYILFNDGTLNVGGYNTPFIIATHNQAEVARFYQSTFGRTPDLPGYEAWTQVVDSGTMSIHQTAIAFVSSAEFASRYGAVDTLTDTQFVTDMYTNVLGRAPDSSGLAAWISYLGTVEASKGGTTAGNLDARAIILEAFATSNEEVAHSSSWLIDRSIGGHADAGSPLPASTVISQGDQNHYIDFNNTTPPTGTVNASDAILNNFGMPTYGSQISTNSTGTGVYSALDDTTYILSKNINSASIVGTNNIVYGSSYDGGEIDVNGSGNTIVIGSGKTTIVANPLSPGSTESPISIQGFKVGKDILQDTLTDNGSKAVVSVDPATILDASNGAHFSGTSYSFNVAHANASAAPIYVLKLGDVGGGTAAEVATAINKVYSLADTTAEHFTIIGQVTSNSSVASAGDTIVYAYGKLSGAYQLADTNHNGVIDAGELSLEAKLVGVSTSNLTHVDFGSGQ